MSRIRVKRPVDRLRAGEYAAHGEQLDALWKIVRVLLVDASPETLAKIPAEALAEMDGIEAVKARFPKQPRRKPKTN